VTEQTSTISPPDFSKVLRDYAHRSPGEASLSGAKLFRKLFRRGKLFGGVSRSESETLDLLVGCGLATDAESARQVANYMVQESTRYSDTFFSTRYFRLQPLRNPSGEVIYHMTHESFSKFMEDYD